MSPRATTRKVLTAKQRYMKRNDKRRRLERLAKGKCPQHADRDVVPGKKSCQECLTYREQQRFERLANGKCVCGNDVAPGCRQCRECLDRYKQHRLARLAKGKCKCNGVNDVVPGRTWCQRCLNRWKPRRAQLLAKGKCPYHPDRDVVPGCRRCKECSNNSNRYSIDIGQPLRRAKKRLVPFEDVSRQVVFDRDEWTCQHCRKHVNGDARADHIIPLSLGGPHTYWNHQTLCDPCNASKLNSIQREPKLAHLLHLPIRKLIESFAKENGAALPRGWWELRTRVPL